MKNDNLKKIGFWRSQKYNYFDENQEYDWQKIM
jgi:hypothetical protein